MRKWITLSLLMMLFSCRPGPDYHSIPIPDRKTNLLGLERIATKHLDAHPDDFLKFSRILTSADNALQNNETITRSGAMAWIGRALKKEGMDETMPVMVFLRSVYLKGWEGAYLTTLDEGEREYLYDLMGAVMGGMHRCSCVATHPSIQHKTP
jgi:hypothetical protein